ncbi:Cupin 4 family protein [Sphingobium herbicidovorans NBRC 16415]|uniref:Cupin 4 family protein n=1 Tax=Sphingobium herbicidovorans (strain ATCC 700291 / DSM 11019 / CCUG 56400 / KCTC 2939 / LMG 18315 / NBRC 16415 / MH) TaxID=1219045 RepID=A0A086P661_SPHHM|nr:cupin domain-containing protein [Sphingobium herbicidovorans]KFG88879.1 Cupin 4 family protein [Sphingobium herbicidovorans NBRC 16415]
MYLADFDIELFLRDYWQQRPLLIRNPWAEWRNPLEPDELAGLACEDAVESRLITTDGDVLKMESGPLPEARFGELGNSPWTLVVQAVDHHAPAVAELVEPFRFIPNWRIDDVMVSYATDGGGVGPHFDQYDVFLIQGLGKRRWRVGPRCNSATPLLPHEDLRLIADFEATGEWILEPGDMLYVPPCFAHDGVAVGDDCMTYSIGFRAPSRAELIESWCEHQADAAPEEDRYADPALPVQDNPGEITAPALNRLHAMVMEALSDREAFARWFGLHNSLPKYADADWRPEDPIDQKEVQSLLAQGIPLKRNPASRFSFIRQGVDILLFVDGHCFECAEETAGLAEQLGAAHLLKVDPALCASHDATALIKTLIDQGSLAFEEED